MAATRSRSKRDEKDDAEQEDGNGRKAEAPIDEGELASYLQERIKPGLNRGAIPLLARSIAREIARDEFHREDSEKDEPGENGVDGDTDLATALHKLQGQLGSDWVLSLCVHGEDSWLVAEKSDVSQRIEAQDASVLRQAVKLLDDGGGRARRSDDDD